ncbi:hypothetical protein [uncultured Brevundimonas sp.]|uniref:hypothetical protein n=1 Tax=uncultured Brevundimonas sp. TaxID=213418 RepID=UPI002629EFC2|nr:hypothetical protein [uncultured Brevundimonas sp.]
MSKLIASVKTAAMVAVVASATACVSISEVSGPYKAGGGTYTLDRSWNDITPVTGHLKEVRLLTLDGPGLNSLYLSSGLKEGQHLARPNSRREKTTPAWRADMGILEQVEFVKESVEAYGYNDVTTSSPRPVNASGHRGVRFDLAAVTTAGLRIKGYGQLVTKDGQAYVAIYLAPEEHFYADSQANALSAMDSLTF